MVTHVLTMSKQKRRIEVATGTSGVANNYIDIDFEHSTEINVHNFRMMSSVEPEIGDANCNGIWAVWVLPSGLVQNADLPTSFGAFGDDSKYGAYLWGMGVFTASNQTPATWEFAPKTSRNIQRDGRIVYHLLFAGVSSGLVRHNTCITCYTT